jgi:hypothetical protein
VRRRTQDPKNIAPVRELVARWRERAEDLRLWAAAEGAAKALESAADELDSALRDEDNQTLSLAEASRRSGYTADHLGRMVRGGRIANAGRKNAPRVRARDLPQKPGTLSQTGVTGHIDRDAIARAVITRHNGGA